MPRSATNSGSTTRKSATQIALEDLSSSGFTFSPDIEFERNRERLNRLYIHFFNPSEIDELKRSDSIFAWANILSLESARALENAHRLPALPITLQQRIANRNEQTNENLEMQALVNQSRILRERSLALYEKALDNKFALYYPKALEFVATTHRLGSENMIHMANSQFMEAEERLNSLLLLNPEQQERYLSLKRRAVEMLEQSLETQAAGAPTRAATQAPLPGRFITSGAQAPRQFTPASRAPVGNETPTMEPKDEPRKSATELAALAFAPQAGTVEFKVQIGAFRTEPNATALSKIPPVTREKIPGTELHRFYSGSWKTQSEAQAQVQRIRDAGFQGAFVVAFLNGEKISLERASQINQ